MNKRFSLVLMFTALAFAFTSCSKNDDKSLDVSSVTFNTTAYDKWIYFSFDANAEVAVSNFQTSTDWDIAFHRYDVRVNCGTSGPGLGGSYNMGKVDFASVVEAPVDGYSLNTQIKIYETSPMTGGSLVSVPGDTLLAKWLTFNHTETGGIYSINDNIYVIKTAKGKYAKIWLKDYYSDDAKPGYVTMSYLYQPDGSRKFE